MAMAIENFFAFCTSLKPLELRAIGALSWVRHMNEGEVLYSPGEPGKAFYIINRGVLEVLPEKRRHQHNSVYLSRGDVIGDIEVFSGVSHMHLVRAQEAVSLQCFPQANFPELVRRVPTFFRFLCEQMAGRLLKARDLAGEQSQCLELSGRLSNFDLATIHQTIVCSGQTGELAIRDEKDEKIGAFYFDSGRPFAGQFQHLTGEEAFWQLFLTEPLTGTFSFSVGERPLTDWIESGRIAQKSSDLLIVALQFRDELNALKGQMLDDSAEVSACTAELQWNGDAPEQLKPLANRIWTLMSHTPRTIRDLYRECSVCELKVYQVVSQLVSLGQATFN
jgi:CRP-like cAMP-binding protein